MKVSDYIVEYFINKGIKDVFGYPGGMITQLMDSFLRYENSICAHLSYHEQAAAFAACGYAQTSGKPGLVYATSGPGATNLITGICNAYFDSIPVIFITGQVNTNETKNLYSMRQRGFQETDIVSMVKPVTKYAVYINKAEVIPAELEKAYQIAVSERKGPVLLDISMNIFRSEITNIPDNFDKINSIKNQKIDTQTIIKTLSIAFFKANSPVFLIGGGVKTVGLADKVKMLLSKLKIPVISSMIAFDVMKNAANYYGFIGAYGDRAANFIAAKSDLIISIGSRLDIRQVGINRVNFAPNSNIIRFDIDEDELKFKVHENEIQFCVDLETALTAIKTLQLKKDYTSWILICNKIRELLSGLDKTYITNLIETISENIPDDVIITTDVGQNQVWIAQYFKLKSKQKVLFSGGHGAMGYSLPAAIGACYGSGGKNVYCFTGDGGLQMNIQEFQFIVRENLPIKIIVLNNNALGMIRHFQEIYYQSRYFQTKSKYGYTAPNFSKIAAAYGIFSRRIKFDDVKKIKWYDAAELLEIMLPEDTYITPKLEFGKPNQDQEPLIDRSLYKNIMDIQITPNRGGGYRNYKVKHKIPYAAKFINWRCAA